MLRFLKILISLLRQTGSYGLTTYLLNYEKIVYLHSGSHQSCAGKCGTGTKGRLGEPRNR